jgi:glycerophosphoryl diester phosphodiesterase
MIRLIVLFLSYITVSHTEPLIACHRGITCEWQENTEDSLRSAIRRNVPIIDIDVMVTIYGDIVCNHDDNIKDLVIDHKDIYIRNLTHQDIETLVMSDTIIYNGSDPLIIHYNHTNKWAFLPDLFDRYIDNIIFWLDIKSRQYRLYAPDNTVDVINDFLFRRLSKMNRIIVTSSNPAVILDLVKAARQKGYSQLLQIGMDYSMDLQYWNRFALETGQYEQDYKLTVMTTGNNILTQAMIDKRINMTIIPYPYEYGQRPVYTNIYAYLVDYARYGCGKH